MNMTINPTLKRIALLLGIGCVSLALMSGCSNKPRKEVIKDEDLVSASYSAAKSLLREAERHDKRDTKWVNLHRHRPIIVASFVDIDDLQNSSSFGRIVAEQMGSYIAQQGHKVIEMKLRNNVFIQQMTGELLLSRELRNISFQHDAYAVLVGTYAESKRIVYVSAKLIRAEDSVILASHDYSMPVGTDTKRLLRADRR